MDDLMFLFNLFYPFFKTDWTWVRISISGTPAVGFMLTSQIASCRIINELIKQMSTRQREISRSYSTGQGTARTWVTSINQRRIVKWIIAITMLRAGLRRKQKCKVEVSISLTRREMIQIIIIHIRQREDLTMASRGSPTKLRAKRAEISIFQMPYIALISSQSRLPTSDLCPDCRDMHIVERIHPC